MFDVSRGGTAKQCGSQVMAPGLLRQRAEGVQSIGVVGPNAEKTPIPRFCFGEPARLVQLAGRTKERGDSLGIEPGDIDRRRLPRCRFSCGVFAVHRYSLGPPSSANNGASATACARQRPTALL